MKPEEATENKDAGKPESEFLPPELAELTLASYWPLISKRSISVYLAVCFGFLVLLFSIYIIKVTISKQATGIIRAATELSQVRSLISGRVKELYIKENQKVNKGDTLCIIESEILNAKQDLLFLKRKEIEDFISDLKKLTTRQFSSLSTNMYLQRYQNYQNKLKDANTRLNKAKVNLDRQQKLFNERVIAAAEFENYEFEYNKANNDLAQMQQSELTEWHQELRNYEIEIQDIKAQIIQIEKEKLSSIIKAPVSGNIQSLTGVYPGGFVFINQDIALISPETGLIVEAYVNPNTIGYIHAEMPVRFQINAFNYNQWGLANGKVIEISNDVHIINDQPIFKIKCQLNQDFLQLKSGQKGYLKKGMTVLARFELTERTIFQLLFDKVDDWLNPNTFVSAN